LLVFIVKGMPQDWITEFHGKFHSKGLTLGERFIKRAFDLLVAAIGISLTWWIIAIAYLLAWMDTGQPGFFVQHRVGRYGKLFNLFKIRSMRDDPKIKTTVTTANDPRITRLGRFFRRLKIDELPQLFNVLMGDMTIVGPRPDVLGFADRLQGDDRIILTIRPGVIGPGTLKYLYEEEALARQPNPEQYNREVIFPDKVRLNRAYVENYSFWNDLKYIFKTFQRIKYHHQ